MRFLSMFSGIDAASVAWNCLGWKAAAFCEIEPFPSAVLAHRYPNVPNLGDVTKADFDAIGPVDLIVFGSPCQSFSVAGKRLGLDDPRGNLALLGGRVVYHKRARWFVFENVPGLLSSDGGWDFGTLLAAFAGYQPGSVFAPPEGGWRSSGVVEQAGPNGYGLAWRVLDAQYVRVDGYERAVPQRRRRVFVVGYLGDWRRAAAVLFERESLRWDSPPSREARKGPAPTLSARTRGGGGLGTDFDLDGGLIPLNSLNGASHAVAAERGVSKALDATMETYVGAFGGNNTAGNIDVAAALNAKGGAGRMDFESETLVAHALRADGFDASEDGAGRGTPLVPVAIGFQTRGSNLDVDGEVTGTIGSNADRASGSAPCIAFDTTQITHPENRCQPKDGDPCHPLAAQGHPPALAFHARQDPCSGDVAYAVDSSSPPANAVQRGWQVRRLTPEECEALQGFPRGYTAITYRGKPAADGPRYKALGNSMACNVMRWIGQRIALVEEMTKA